MNFVEVIGNYDKASNRRRRIIGMAIVIAIIALFFIFNSISAGLISLPEALFVEAPSPTQSEIRNSPVPTELPNTAAATVFPSPTNATVQSSITPDAVEATRSWRSQAVQDAIRNRG